MRADHECRASIDGGARLLALGLARLKLPLQAEVEQHDDEVGLATGGPDVLHHRGDVEPGYARGVVCCCPDARVEAGALHGPVT